MARILIDMIKAREEIKKTGVKIIIEMILVEAVKE